MNYWPLLGIAIVVLGFALRFNPLMVVVGAALATGLLAGLDLVAVTEALGKAFNDNRYISVTWIILPVIGLLERYGLQQNGGNPAVIGAVGMLAGFCGTLMTPMAAKFNIVPAALLELKDQNGVIRQQIGTALPLWVCNVAIIYAGAFLLWN